MNRRLILASTSSARRTLMDSLGVTYEAMAPGVDEDVPQGTSVPDAVAMLAERKARAVFEREPDALVIGSDQLVSLDGHALSKPADRDEARSQLRRLSGRVHEIVTGVCLIAAGVATRHVEVTRMKLYPLREDELERYLDLEEWRGCAGGYRVESAGQALFEEITGDRTNVQGLPMHVVVRLLRTAGFDFFQRAPTRGA